MPLLSSAVSRLCSFAFLTAAAAALIAAAPLEAQTATGAPLVTLASASYGAYIASDTSGNVYSVNDVGTGVYKQTRAANGSYTNSTLSLTTPSPGISIAVDTSGRLFIGLQSGDVVRYTPSGSTYTGPVYVATSAGKGTTPASGIALDNSGNVYIPDRNNAVIYKETVSGGATYTQSTLGISLTSPQTVAVDGSGNLYINDVQTNALYKETLSGGSYTQTLIASNIYASGLVVDSAGNIFLADRFSSNRARILRETPNGPVYTQTLLSFTAVQSPLSIALDSLGNLYLGVAQTGALGIAGILEMMGGASASPNVALGSTAQMKVGFNILSSGTLGSLTNANVVLQGLSGSEFTLGSGSTCTGFVTAGGTCSVGVTFTPQAVGLRMGAVNLLNSAGAIIATAYIGGIGTGALATLSPGILSTVVATGIPCSSTTAACGDGGVATATGANLNNPQAAAVDSVGNLYIADSGDNRIRKLTVATNVLSTVAGTGTACISPTVACGDGGLATAATLNGPTGVAIDGAGNLYISDRNDQRIRVVNAATGIISAFAGNGNACATATAACGDNGAATSANMSYPYDVTADVFGNVYISTYDQKIRKVTSSTGVISTVVGSGNQCSPSTATCGDGSGIVYPSAALSFPGAIAVDAAQNLYIADSGDNRIRLAAAMTGNLSTYAGTGTTCNPSTAACGDGGAATSATLNYPFGVALDAAGNLYLSDNSNARIREISASTGLISTIAGTGVGCSTFAATCGDGGSATATGATLGYPAAIALDSAGNLYIPEQGTNRVRTVSTKSGIVFPTATPAGSSDSTDGTRTVTVNNIGNTPLQFTSQVETGSSFVLGNPMTGGCVPNGTIASGAGCLIGARFAPVAGSTGFVTGNVILTDNALNVSGSQQGIPLTGTINAGSVSIDIGSNTVTQGMTFVYLPVVIGYAGSQADQGAITVMVNGSTAGVNPPTACGAKSSHKSCLYTYNGPLLNTPGSFPTSASVSADAANGYAAASTPGYLTVNGVAGNAHPAPGGPINLPAVSTPLPSHASPVPAQTAPALPAASGGALVVSSAIVSPDSPEDPTTVDDQTTTGKKGVKARP